MKIVLSQDDVMEILCGKYGLKLTYNSQKNEMEPGRIEDKIYWEGNLESKEE